MSTVAPRYEAVETRVAEAGEPRGGWRKGRVAAAFAVAWMLSGLYIVMPDQQAVVTQFGRVVAARVMPGLHYALPWPAESVWKIKVRQAQRLMLGGTQADSIVGRTQPLVSQFLTGDQNIINVRVVVQYSVSVPSEYLFQAQDPASLVGEAVEAEMARRIAHRDVDAVLTTEKAAIQEETRAAAQRVLNGYKAGVEISSVNFESAAPPAEAADAFRDVASARADAVRIVNDAQGYANDEIPKARGQAQQMREQAAGYRERKVNEASGDAARFEQVAAEYAKASDVTARRIYLETMELVLPKIRKVVVDRQGNVELTMVGRK